MVLDPDARCFAPSSLPLCALVLDLDLHLAGALTLTSCLVHTHPVCVAFLATNSGDSMGNHVQSLVETGFKADRAEAVIVKSYRYCLLVVGPTVCVFAPEPH